MKLVVIDKRNASSRFRLLLTCQLVNQNLKRYFKMNVNCNRRKKQDAKLSIIDLQVL